MIYSVLDFETTGFGPSNSRVLEVGIVKISSEGEIIDYFDTLINPLRNVGATWIHGITADMVEQAPLFGDVVDGLLQFLDGSIIVAHNSSFDIPFLREELRRAGRAYTQIPSICTLRLSRKHIMGCGSYSLGSLCSFLHIENRLAHSALADADATSQLLLHLIRQYGIEGSIEPGVLFSNHYQDRKQQTPEIRYTRGDYLG